MSLSSRQVPKDHYDIVIAGGGILGAALAWEASLRGAGVLLLERNDFGCGASANSLKILHGGLRYLQSCNIGRARRSACEQELLQKMAPHLIEVLPCVVPTEQGLTRSRWAYALGLEFYYRVIRLGLAEFSDNSNAWGLSSVERLAELAPLANYGHVTGAAYWEDARVLDPVRLVLEFILCARELGSDCLNYKEVAGCITSAGIIQGVTVSDALTGDNEKVDCDLLIDATGAGLPGVPGSQHPAVEWCKGVNLGLNLPAGKHAFGISASGDSKTDKRFLFLTPWREVTVAGTWYFPGPPEQPRSKSLKRDEAERCLSDINSVLKSPIGSEDIRYVDIGYLPIAKGEGELAARLLDKDYLIEGKQYGLTGYIRPVGVKYTTARSFAEKIIREYVGKMFRLRDRKPVLLPGARFDRLDTVRSSLSTHLPRDFPVPDMEDIARRFGARAGEIAKIIGEDPSAGEFVPTTRTTVAEIRFVCKTEQVETAADLILRRTAMAATGRPSAKAVQFVLDYLAEQRDWSPARIERERVLLNAGYNRISD